MNKNSIGANFTGTGLKRSKKYYSDADAGKYYFKPDHSEFYGGGQKKVNKNKLGNKAKEMDNKYFDLDIVHVPGAASVRKSTSRNIVDTMRRDKVESDDMLYNDDLLQDEIIPAGEDDMGDMYENMKSLRINHVSMSPVVYDHTTGDKDFRKERNMKDVNAKSLKTYRNWQDFQRTGGYQTIDQEVSEYDIMEDARAEASNTKSELEDILETKPHIVWSGKDENQLYRDKHRKVA